MTYLALIVALLGAFFAASCAWADGALLSIDPDDELDPRLRELHERRERLHRALSFARLIGQLTAGIATAVMLGLSARPFGTALLIALGAAILMVGLSESLARSTGDAGGSASADRLLAFTGVIARVLSPVVSLGSWFDDALDRLLPPAERDEEDAEATADQFRQVVAAEAEVTRDQEILLNGVFALGSTEVHEIMVPRVDILAIDHAAPWSEVVDKVRSSGHARLPVYVETIDDIIGILYAKDVLASILTDVPFPEWPRAVRPAVIVPGAKKADALLREFQASGTHIAIVVDEYGGTEGLVTIEDVLEEIVGDIRDEYDEEDPNVEQEDGKRYWVSGRMTLSELSGILGQDLHHDDVTTVGGLIYELLGRVPKAGEELSVGGFRVVVERVVRRRIQRVYFERTAVSPGRQA